jgi:hypothetical protein
VDRITEIVAIYYERLEHEDIVAVECKWDGGDDVIKACVEGPTIMSMIYRLIEKRIPFGKPFYGPGVSAPDQEQTDG